MTKHIGIVACSAEGAALCYRTICMEGPAALGRHMHPEVSMHTFPLGRYVELIYAGDWDSIAELMVSSASKLADIGADFCICPDNTIHQAIPKVVDRSPLPWLHIAEVVTDVARLAGFKHLGVLGTKYLMTGPVYRDALGSAGIVMTIPEEDIREQIDTFIFDELVNAVFKPETKDFFNKVIGNLKQRGCDAVVLGCTEIPLIVDPDTSPLPTLDSTRLLAGAALKESMS